MFTPFFELLKYYKSFRTLALKGSLYSFLKKLFDVFPEILIGMSIDVVVSKQNSFIGKMGVEDPWDQVLILGVLTFVVWGGESFFEYLSKITWRNLAQLSQHHLRLDSFSHVSKLSLEFYENNNSASLISIMNDDVNQLERFLDGGADNVIQTATSVVLVGGVFFYLSWEIALCTFIPMPFIILGAFAFHKKAEPLYDNVRGIVSQISRRMNNALSGIVIVKSFTNENLEIDLTRRKSEDYLTANQKAIALSSAFIPIIRMFILAGFLVTLILGSYKVLHGEIGVGAFGTLVFLTQRLLWPLTSLAETVDLFQRAMASTKRVLELIQSPLPSTKGKKIIENLKGEFKIKNLDFSYSQGPKVLENITSEIEAGKTTAVVGSTGSGKSTFVKLLLKFYECSSIVLDDVDLMDVETNFLRNQIGYVGQDVFLFDGTIRENILYGKADATDEEIANALKLSECEEFILKLDKGVNQLVGERGVKLSGGQRQRLSIARALVRNPKILIFDEATSAVDNELNPLTKVRQILKMWPVFSSPKKINLDFQ